MSTHNKEIAMDTKYPYFSTEVHRYDKPVDGFGFHFMQALSVGPAEINNWPTVYSEEPFGEDAEPYACTELKLVNTEDAELERRMLMQMGFEPKPITEVPKVLQEYIKYRQCPIEWHQFLAENSSHFLKRITVWVFEEPTVTITLEGDER